MVTPPSGLTGIQLLNSSISMWATNVLIFSVVYWRLDRGGNEARAEGTPGTQDWHFPRQDAEDGSQWRPTYVDYLFLAFCTATAFSPAEAMPMTALGQADAYGGEPHFAGYSHGDGFAGDWAARQLGFLKARNDSLRRQTGSRCRPR